jgi:hypothetical protein
MKLEDIYNMSASDEQFIDNYILYSLTHDMYFDDIRLTTLDPSHLPRRDAKEFLCGLKHKRVFIGMGEYNNKMYQCLDCCRIYN